MYLTNLLSKVHDEFAPDKMFNFRVRFPNLDSGKIDYVGGGNYGPGRDPCPYKSWFPAESVDEISDLSHVILNAAKE